MKDGFERLKLLHVSYKIFNCGTLKFPVSVSLGFLALSSPPLYRYKAFVNLPSHAAVKWLN